MLTQVVLGNRRWDITLSAIAEYCLEAVNQNLPDVTSLKFIWEFALAITDENKRTRTHYKDYTEYILILKVLDLQGQFFLGFFCLYDKNIRAW